MKRVGVLILLLAPLWATARVGHISAAPSQSDAVASVSQPIAQPDDVAGEPRAAVGSPWILALLGSGLLVAGIVGRRLRPH